MLGLFYQITKDYIKNFVKGFFKVLGFSGKFATRIAGWQFVLGATAAYFVMNLALWYAGGCRF